MDDLVSTCRAISTYTKGQQYIDGQSNEGMRYPDNSAAENLARKSTANQKHDVLQSIPPELVSLIFEFATISQASPLTLPFLLGSVCNFWRLVAWTTPSLWNNIVFFLDGFNLSSRIALLEEIIQRSKALPLTLNIHEAEALGSKVPPRNGFSASEDFHRLVSTILGCSTRWYNLDFDVSPFYLRFLLSPGCPGPGRSTNAPNLRGLRLPSLVTRNGGGPLSAEIDFSSLAPNLRKFVLMEHFDIDSLSNSLCWENLVELTVNSTVAACVRAINRAPSLRYIQLLDSATQEPIEVEVWLTREPLDRQPFLHHDLQKVDIQVGNPPLRRSTSFFEDLTLPCVKDLSLSFGQFPTFEPIISFISRSKCSLTRLRLDSVLYRLEDLCALLANLSSVVQLEIADKSSPIRAKDYCNTIFFPKCVADCEQDDIPPPVALPNLGIFHLDSSWTSDDGLTFLNGVLDIMEDYRRSLSEFSLSLFASGSEGRGAKLDEATSRRVRTCHREGRTFECVMYGEEVEGDLVALSSTIVE